MQSATCLRLLTASDSNGRMSLHSGPFFIRTTGIVPRIHVNRRFVASKFTGAGGFDHLNLGKGIPGRGTQHRCSGSSMPYFNEAETTVGTNHNGDPSPIRVAVIGAGASGLVTARELLREGHCVTVFEQGSEVGGVWLYDPRVEDDPLGVTQSKDSRVFSSMYSSLRTNLPREVMSFLDFPFRPPPGSEDVRRYPGHQAVADYLNYFADYYNLRTQIQFRTTVFSVSPSPVKYNPPASSIGGGGEDGVREAWTHWDVESCTEDDVRTVDCFQAVVVANGHYSDPKIADVRGQHVAVIGAASSGEDISREIADVAASVHLCSRGWGPQDCPSTPHGARRNMWKHPMIEELLPTGEAVFQDGTRIFVQLLLHCTGYTYSFPFLRGCECLSVEDQRVGPLFDHVFPPTLAPTLAFVGLPWNVVPFQMCQLQAKWIARVLGGRARLPSQAKMEACVKQEYLKMEGEGIAVRYSHRMGGQDQWDYIDRLAARCGLPYVEKWREQMHKITSANKRTNPTTYRDEFVDENLVLEALLAQADQP